MCKRKTRSYHQVVHTNNQARSALHHTLRAIQYIHKDDDKVTCEIHNSLKKEISEEGHHHRETRLQHDITGEAKY